jgi:hypothetical protein
MKKNYLQLPQTSITLAALVFVIVLLFWGCNEVENVTPLYDKTLSNVATPEIISISPADSAFAGVDEITINGNNFPASSSEVSVFFNNVPVTIISIDANKIVVKAPNLVSDSISIKVNKFRANKLSNVLLYKLISATLTFVKFNPLNTPYSVTFDKFGNAYVSLILDKTGAGIKKITPDGEITNFAPKGTETSWSSLKFGQSSDLYAARRVKGIVTIAEGATAKTWVSSSNGIGIVADFDFDPAGNIWAGGDNTSLYRVTQSKNVKAFAFTASVRAVRVYNNFLFVAGLKDGSEGVWRFPIVNSDSLGTGELYYDYKANYPTGSIQAITFSADGDLYIGTDGVETIVVVKSDKSSKILFDGILNPLNKSLFNSFYWGSGVYLYFIRQAIDATDAATAPVAIIKVNTKNILGGAPYYGNN